MKLLVSQWTRKSPDINPVESSEMVRGIRQPSKNPFSMLKNGGTKFYHGREKIDVFSSHMFAQMAQKTADKSSKNRLESKRWTKNSQGYVFSQTLMQ